MDGKETRFRATRGVAPNTADFSARIIIIIIITFINSKFRLDKGLKSRSRGEHCTRKQPSLMNVRFLFLVGPSHQLFIYF